MFDLKPNEVRWVAVILILTTVIGGLAGYFLFYEPTAMGIKVWPLVVLLVFFLILVLVIVVRI